MRLVRVFGAVAAALIFVVWMTLFPDNHSWRQKLTLVVETPDREVSGSSVVEVRASFYQGGQVMSGTEVHYEITGEATVVEVLPGRFLIALMGDSEELFARAAKNRFEGMTRGAWLRAIPGQTEAVTLTDDLIPMLVTFDDITKPETVRRVNPEDLEAAFGEGVRLKAVTLEITEEAVTEGQLRRVFDYFWWDSEVRQQYSCKVYGCGLNPMRYSLPDGRTDALTELDFFQ
jgi:hypothetical protein